MRIVYPLVLYLFALGLVSGVWYWGTKSAPVPASLVAPSATSTVTAAATTTPTVATYHSPVMGVALSYDASLTSVKERAGTIYIYAKGSDPTHGQKLTIFSKPMSESLEQSIRRQILQGYSSACSVEVTHDSAYPASYAQAEITYPPPSDPAQPFCANAQLCNAAYDKANGVRYFLYDKNHPDRFYFLDIGQYAITASSSQPWQDTITIR